MYKNEIRKYRKEKGLTLKELASNVGITAGYLCHLEKGTRSNPSVELMENIAKELNKKINEIFFSENN